MHAHIEGPCNKLKDVPSKLKRLKFRLENLKKKLKTFQFYV